MCSCCLVSHIRREPEAETKDAAEASEAAAEQQKQHKNWVTKQRRFTFGLHGTPAAAGAAAAARAAEDWEMGNAGAEAAATAAGGAAEDGPGTAAEAKAYRAGPPAKPANWPTMIKTQRRHWYKQGGNKWSFGSRLNTKTNLGTTRSTTAFAA